MSDQSPAKVLTLPPASTAPAAAGENKIDMSYLVRALIKYNASDLHIKVGRPPLYRINGRLVPAKMPELSHEQVQSIIYGVLTDRQKVDLDQKRHVDLSFGVKVFGRFRCNVFFQRGTMAAAIRMIPLTVPSLAELGLPPVLQELCYRPRGLILVTGPTGSGKSTTLAAMLQHINANRHLHILSIEDPIEFLHRDIKSSISQREVGSDAHSAQEALFSGLRQDPDIIMISEIRNAEMIQTALTAAETGHLVLTTLHTNDACGSIDRILDVFPPDARNQVRVQLASSLLAVVSQQLLLRTDGQSRVCASEIMIKSPTIENLILKNEIDKIQDAIAASGNYYQMQTMNVSLEKLVRSGQVTAEEALKCSNNASDLQLRLSGMNRNEGYELGKGQPDETEDSGDPQIERFDR